MREASSTQTYTVGNETIEFTCFSSNDGITYKNNPPLEMDQCPMAGQKLLLALLVASLISYAIAAALKPPHAGNGGGDYRTFQAAGHANSSGAGTKGGASALEDELSNSALQVLRQMEDIEVRSGPAQLASVAEEDEERGEEALGKGSKSRPAKASTHSAGRHRSSAHRSGHRGGSMRGGMGSSYAPRTSISLVNKTLSMTAQSRTSSYAEPHLDTKASSVAFSFYDGGDSDDDDDGDAPIPAPPSAGTGPAVPSKDAKRGMTYEAARAALEFAVLLGVCVVGEHRMPSGRLPAGTTLDSENPDLWAFIMALLFLVSLLNVEVLEEGTEVFLSRAQANEWKGWMQVAFVAYRRGVRRCAGASAAGRRGGRQRGGPSRIVAVLGTITRTTTTSTYPSAGPCLRTCGSQGLETVFTFGAPRTSRRSASRSSSGV